MYSAFDGEHKFVVPATVEGVKKIKWSASDPSMVDLEPSADGSTVNIIMRKAGTVKIVAKAGSLTGEVPLTITKATAQEWEEGSQRYNNGVVIRRGPPGPGAGGPPADGGAPGITKTAACTNCHNSGGGGSDVEHTPMQTGGYSDDDLINIFANGKKPAGVEQRLMPADRWSKIHQWEMSAEEKKGIIVYLRSLTPKSQGALDFGGPRGGGGGGRRDGGAPGGGAGGGTGGGGGNRDGGSVN
jgi:hypothetical protein